MFKIRTSLTSVIAAAALLCTAEPARSGVIPVTSLVDLGADDSINWGQFGPTGTVLLDPVTPSALPTHDPFGPISTTNGMAVEGLARSSMRIPPFLMTDLVVDSLSGLPSLKMAYGEDGGFRPPFTRGISMEVMLTFDQPIYGFGAEIFMEQLFFPGNARIDAFDSTGLFLGSTGGSGGPFHQFLGLRTDSATPDIKTIRILGFGNVSEFLSARGIFEFGEAGLVTGAGASEVPEPGSAILALLGMLSTAAAVGCTPLAHRFKRSANRT